MLNIEFAVHLSFSFQRTRLELFALQRDCFFAIILPLTENHLPGKFLFERFAYFQLPEPTVRPRIWTASLLKYQDDVKLTKNHNCMQTFIYVSDIDVELKKV